MDRRVIFLAIALLTPLGFASGGEDCDNFVAPVHAVDDGHKHWHHMAPTDGHYHGEAWFDAGHMHMDHHSQCNQVGMERVMFQDALPLQKMNLQDAVIGETPSTIVGDEAFAFSTDKQQVNLNLPSDQVIAAMGFPGSGTEADPYIVEGYHISERLNLANTDACVVIRNNLIAGQFLTGPMVNPEDIIMIPDELAIARGELQEANAALQEANGAVQAARATYDEARDVWIAFAEGRAPFLADVQEANSLVTAARDAYNKVNQERLAERDQYRALKFELQDLAGTNLPDAPQLGLVVAEYDNPDWNVLAAEAETVYMNWQQANEDRAEAIEKLQAAKLLRTEAKEELVSYDVNRDVSQTPMLDARTILQQAKADRAPFQTTALEARAERDMWRDLMAQGNLLWNNIVFEDLDGIVNQVLEAAEDKALEDAKLILDWNGQCVHAYNNIVDDLRVNQNNARTGYATGGIIEDNRIFDVGQLRHYDGIFRENEVGNYDQLQAFQSGTEIEEDRAANVDGFNQGQLTSNTFYGFVDLDFHGHHHSTGFYAPHSHYHGDDPTKGMTHDHTERWTSVNFEDNVVIDPSKYGLRYEDRNHAGDDRTANSESEQSLNKPHVHRTDVRIEENLIVGSIFVDEFNADGIQIWSDDFTEVAQDLPGQVVDLATHFGANIVNTHRARNDGWLTIQGNQVLHPNNGFAAIDLLDLKEAEVSIIGNDAKHIGAGSAPGAGDIRNWQAGWSGDSADATGLELRDWRDSVADICGNTFSGFSQGLQATMAIMEDVAIRTCADNEFGGDRSVSFTAYPDEETNTLSPIREATEETAAEPAADFIVKQTGL